MPNWQGSRDLGAFESQGILPDAVFADDFDGASTALGRRDGD